MDGDGLPVTWNWEQAAKAMSNSCIAFLTGILRLIMGVLLPDMPSDGPSPLLGLLQPYHVCAILSLASCQLPMCGDRLPVAA